MDTKASAREDQRERETDGKSESGAKSVERSEMDTKASAREDLERMPNPNGRRFEPGFGRQM